MTNKKIFVVRLGFWGWNFFGVGFDFGVGLEWNFFGEWVLGVGLRILRGFGNFCFWSGVCRNFGEICHFEPFAKRRKIHIVILSVSEISKEF